MERRIDRDARPRRSRRFPGRRPRFTSGSRTVGAPGGSAGAGRAKLRVAPLALLCHSAPLDGARPCREPLAIGGDRMIRYRTIESPIGPLTLAGPGPTLTQPANGASRPIRQAAPAGCPMRDAFADAVDQLVDYFAGKRTEFDLQLELRGLRIPAASMERIADDTVRGNQVVWTNRRTDRRARFCACGRTGQRPKSDRHCRALPPRNRCKRQPHRLRRRN